MWGEHGAHAEVYGMLRAQVAALTVALEFYANTDSYNEFGTPVIKHEGHRSCNVPDMGKAARAALKLRGAE